MEINFIDSIDFTERSSLDRFNPKGHVKITNELGEVVFEGFNKITLAGAGFLARALFDIKEPEITPSYNNALSLDNTVISSGSDVATKVCLFCVGTDGCGRENSAVRANDYKHWIDEDSIVPFQYRPQRKDLTEAEKKEIYMGRKTIKDKYYAYYFKKFDGKEVFTQQLIDGTPIDGTIYDDTSDREAQTIVTMKMSITNTDCRDYFIETTGIDDARVNSISLCTAWLKTIGGMPYYQDIRPVTRLNFPNEPLIDLTKSLNITYSIYF